MDMVSIFTALADPTRLKIVEMLAKQGALSASELAAPFDMSAPAVSQHLKILREANAIGFEKQAQRRIYQLNPKFAQRLLEWGQSFMQNSAPQDNYLADFLKSRAPK